jgi:hypothetical protein
MQSDQKRLSIPPERRLKVPADQLKKLKAAMDEKVIKPARKRAMAQRETIAKVRARPVR